MSATEILVIRVRLRGLTPVLCDALKPSAWVTRQTGPRVQAAQRLYRLDDGRIAMNVGRINYDMIDQARKQGLTARNRRHWSVVVIDGDVVPLLIPLSDGRWRQAKDKDWKAKVVSGKHPRGGRPIRLSRPSFGRWGVELNLHVQPTDRLTTEMIRQLLEGVGTNCGLGSYSPHNGGNFGQFEVVEWEVVETFRPIEIEVLPM